MILELCNKTIPNLSTLVTTLIILNLSIDHWHVFKIGNIIVLNHKHGATDLDDIVNFQWVEGADFSFSTQTEPGPVSWSHILEIEAWGFALLTLAVSNLGVKVTHLWIFLHVKCIIHISAYAKAHLINSDHSISRRSLKHVQLYNIVFAGGDNPEFTESHLEHHVLSQEDFLPYHDESSSGWPDVSQVEMAAWNLAFFLLDVFDFAVSTTHERFWDHDVVTGRVTAQGCTVLPNNENIVEQLAFDSFKNQDVWIFNLIELINILVNAVIQDI